MNPDTVTQLTNIAVVAIPAVITFFLGHYHVLLSPSTPSVTPTAPPVIPVKPVTPTIPNGLLQELQQLLAQLTSNAAPSQPTNPVSPSGPVQPTQLPIGQGGLLQLVSLVLQGITSHPTATPQQKAEAVSAVVTATAPLVTPKS